MKRITRNIVLCMTWSMCLGNPLIAFWEQTCKMHTDMNHAELKDILKQQNKFNVNNWTHSGLLVLLLIFCLITVVGCCYLCGHYLPLILVANKMRNSCQMMYIPSAQQQQFYSPFKTQVNQERKLHLQEIFPTAQNVS